jgi:hypothetical protein
MGQEFYQTHSYAEWEVVTSFVLDRLRPEFILRLLFFLIYPLLNPSIVHSDYSWRGAILKKD